MLLIQPSKTNSCQFFVIVYRPVLAHSLFSRQNQYPYWSKHFNFKANSTFAELVFNGIEMLSFFMENIPDE